MKKNFIIIFVLILILVIVYITSIFTGLKSPSSYKECVMFGGKTNKNETIVQSSCTYNGKVFEGDVI